MRKLFLIALSSPVVSGATPALTQIAGSWEGTGTGSCPPPFSSPSRAINPWLDWRGVTSTDEDVFSGKWQDALGFYGTFCGETTIGNPEEVCFTGIIWTVIDPYGNVYEMGTFHMHFPYTSRVCHGEWVTYDSDMYQGKMTGQRVDW